MNNISGTELFNWYQQARKTANLANIELLEIDMILTELTELDSLALKLKIYQDKKQISSQVSLEQLNKIWKLRTEKHYPIQYLIGQCYWRNFCLKVTPDVLIPRPETELIIDLVQEIIAQYPHFAEGNFLDLGTGSGAIALGLADTFAQGKIYDTDKSEKALSVAQENALRQQLQTRIKFIQGTWFKPVKQQKNSFSMIISNPPYIPSKLVLELQSEVVNHEPKIALDGGKDGLNDIREIIKSAPDFLIEKGFVILEIMVGQSEEVRELFIENDNYMNVSIHKDLANIDRFVVAQVN